MLKKLTILGSTGSIGVQTLDVIKETNCAEVVAISANSNIQLLFEQIIEFSPKYVCVYNEKKALELKKILNSKSIKVEVLTGLSGLLEISTLSEINMVLNSLVGNIGLIPTVEAIKAKKDIALANKETLVTSGGIIIPLAKENGVNIFPVDSEHSAIFQCLQGNENNIINKIYLTASGGPFRGRDLEFMKTVKIEDALNHPNWSMGNKITIDSSTMMNKGLEVIEAKWLFGVETSQIEVVVHPQSVVHSMVEYEDGAVIAQMGEPDMRVPIQYALTYPKRIKNTFPKIDFFKRNNLTFEKPNLDAFPCLKYAFDAINVGGTMPTVLNASNEIAVELFLAEKISFIEIPKIIEWTMSAYTVKAQYSLNDILEADVWAREFARSKAKTLHI